MVDRVHVTRDRSNGARRRSLVEVHGAPVARTEVVDLGGVAVTSLSRTVLDLARTRTLSHAVAIGDRAIALGLDPEELGQGLARAAHWPGLGQARRVVPFLDGRSESVGESFSRVCYAEIGLPIPDLQFVVFDPSGAFVGRADFCWERQRTPGELDAKITYGRLLRTGETISDLIFAEKVREDALRDHGWQDRPVDLGRLVPARDHSGSGRARLGARPTLRQGNLGFRGHQRLRKCRCGALTPLARAAHPLLEVCTTSGWCEDVRHAARAIPAAEIAPQ